MKKRKFTGTNENNKYIHDKEYTRSSQGLFKCRICEEEKPSRIMGVCNSCYKKKTRNKPKHTRSKKQKLLDQVKSMSPEELKKLLEGLS